MRLIKGLSEKELVARIKKCERTSGLGERGLGFYLLNFHLRGLCRKRGFTSAAQFACIKLQIPLRRTRELLRMARALEELPRIDEAYAKCQVSWSAVRELTRVATADTEEEWLRLAKTNTLRTIERAVSNASRGERPPQDSYTLSKTRLKVVAELSVEDHAIWQAAFDRLSERAGPDLDASTALTTLARTFLEQPLTGEEAKARKAFQVVYHRCTDCDHAWVMTDEGPQGVPARRVEERQSHAQVVRLNHAIGPLTQGDPQGAGSGASACRPSLVDRRGANTDAYPEVACHDDPRGRGPACTKGPARTGGRSALLLSAPGGPAVPRSERDSPNSVMIRQKVLGRDGCRCAVPGCTNRGHLASHHIIWREQGGLTAVKNEVTVCRTCHSLIHEGFLFVAGKAPHGLIWFGPERERLEATLSGPVLTLPEYVKEVCLPAEEPSQKSAHLPDWCRQTLCSELRSEPAPDEKTIHCLDDVPDEVSTAWWRDYGHNFVIKGNRVTLRHVH